jgi:enoyl reductase
MCSLIRRFSRCVLIAILLAFSGTPPAVAADNESSDVSAEKLGDRRYQTIIQFSGAVRLGAGNSAPDATWEPPVCWYEPMFSSEEMRGLLDSSMWQHYVGAANDDPRWHIGDLHEGDEEGKFWTQKCGQGILGTEELAWLNPRPWAIWVAAGDPPPPGGITPEMLAEIVRANLVLPEFKVGVNPPVRSVVNLPTWVWALDLPAEPLWATASLPRGPSATVTARPVGMAIDPGTAEAVTFPAGGTCAGTGKPYRAGMTGEPACGVTYLRPTTGLPEGYQLRAELVWEVTWAGSDGSGGMLPEGRFGSVRQVPVAEIQAIVER